MLYECFPAKIKQNSPLYLLSRREKSGIIEAVLRRPSPGHLGDDRLFEDAARLSAGLKESAAADLKSVTFRYEFELETMKAVSTGDLAWVEDLIRRWSECSHYWDFSYRLPADPLRAEKNTVVIFNTLLRVAAREGGVPPLYIHIISEKYAIAIEKRGSVEELGDEFRAEMIREYADAVHRLSVHGHSKKMVAILEYISANIRTELSRSSIAEAFHISSSHLSQIFKEEMGVSIIQYIQQQRIDLAVYYFELGETNISEVASMVGYGDSSYFTRVFRKVRGISPSACIAQLSKRKASR